MSINQTSNTIGKIIESRFTFRLLDFNFKSSNNKIKPGDKLLVIKEQAMFLPGIAGHEYFKVYDSGKRFHVDFMIDKSLTLLSPQTGYYTHRKIRRGPTVYVSYHNKVYDYLKKYYLINGFQIFNLANSQLLWISVYDMKFLTSCKKNK